MEAITKDGLNKSPDEMLQHLQDEVARLMHLIDTDLQNVFRGNPVFDPMDSLHREWRIIIFAMARLDKVTPWQPGFMFNIVDTSQIPPPAAPNSPGSKSDPMESFVAGGTVMLSIAKVFLEILDLDFQITRKRTTSSRPMPKCS